MGIWLQTTYDIKYWFDYYIVPLQSDFTTGNLQDNQMYNPMTSSMTTTTTTTTIPDEKYVT